MVMTVAAREYKDPVDVVVHCHATVTITARLPRAKAMKIKSTWDHIIDEIMYGGYSAEEEVSDIEATSFYIREIPRRENGSKTP